MANYFTQLFSKLRKNYKSVSILLKKSLPIHPYRVLSIEQDEENSYVVLVQITMSKQIFRMRPEEILANDQMTDSFSQRDVRTLTYLGYLGINSPKYEILAKGLSENDASLIFSIRERGNKKPLIKTASEISSDENFIASLPQKDAHMVGYAIGSELAINEDKQKKLLLNSVLEDKQNN